MTLLWYLKWRNTNNALTNGTAASDSQNYEQFFLGGGKVGESLTANNNWGLCFAFANALWYYCFLGYYFGPKAVFLQIPWSIAVITISFMLPSYINASEHGTVHGFIHHKFGKKAAALAAIATVFGYTINIGFEIFYSAYLISNSIGLGDLAVILGLFLAIFIASYCLAGGYAANVKTDRLQNISGLVATIVLITLLSPLFYKATGSVIFWSSKADFDPLQWHFIFGIIVFSFFFNFVDMANWQSLAANKRSQGKELKKVSRGLISAALMQLFAPALCGVWLGVALKTIDKNIPDDQYFSKALSLVFDSNAYFTGIYIGLILLGFLFITISSAGSYILAGMQTIAVDIVQMDEPSDGIDKKTQTVLWVKRWVTLFSLLTVVVFASLYYGLGAAGIQSLVFQFQFVMYGAAVTLFPTVGLGLLSMINGRKPYIDDNMAFRSILFGLISVIFPFFFVISPLGHELISLINAKLSTEISSDAVINLTPVYGITIAALFCIIPRFRRG